MPEIIDHVAYLSQEIGPRPAGTEEEQQAALYITEHMQKEAGLSAVIEDFNGVPSSQLPRAVCCVATILIVVLALFLPVLGIASIVVALFAALLYAAEEFDRPVLSRVFARGVSQNVVAKYEPGYTAEAGSTRRRKVIVVAHYDSGKVRADMAPGLVGVLPLLQRICLGALVFAPFFQLVRTVFFGHADGALAIILNVITIIMLILVAIPAILVLLQKLAAFNEGANCNASGTAVLMEVARRVGRGRVSAEEMAQRAQADIHGEEAARAAGLIPEGAQLVYEASQMKPPELAPQTPEERLAAAKAAVAALSGQPVSSSPAPAFDISQNLVQVKEPPLSQLSEEDQKEAREEVREAFASVPPDTLAAARLSEDQSGFADASQPMSDGEEGGQQSSSGVSTAEGASAPFITAAASTFASMAAAGAQAHDAVDDGLPAWARRAQEKAKKPAAEDAPIQRSRYATALDAAVSESAGHFAEANRIVENKLEDSLSAGREDIQEIKAPQWTASTSEVTEDSQSAAADSQSAPAVANSAEAAPLAAEATEEQRSGVQQTEASAQDAATAEAKPAADPDSTSAMPPIDVTSLDIKDAASAQSQQQAQQSAQQQTQPRTGNRIDVTAATVDGSGHLDLNGAVMENATDASSTAQIPAVAADAAQAAARTPIVLPDIGVSAASPTPITELPKQRAPLAEAGASGQTAAKSLLNMLPSISLDNEEKADDQEAATSETAADVQDETRSSLKTALPSLSGALPRTDGTNENSSVNAAGSFIAAGATGTFAPVGDELLDNVDPDDIYVDDADDSDYDESITQTGAYAGPGYVDMPKSRVRRLFDRFRKNKKDDEPTPHEWLDVDESFDARTVGAQRGGWESFREEQGEEEFIQNDANPAEATTEFAPLNEEEYDEFDEFDDLSSNDRSRWNGGAFSPNRMNRALVDGDEPAESFNDDPQVENELQQIYQFHNPDIATEVWFVALGSELAGNGGMQAFIAEHQQDMRGSIIIDLGALGAGDLSMIETEGSIRPVKASSRMKRYIKKASKTTGVSVQSSKIEWADSAASYAIKQGFQAMHLVGMDGAKPAYYAQADDVLENIDEDKLNENADFVMELLKNI